MKHYDPIEPHANGPGWGSANDSVMRDIAKLRAALHAVANARTLDEAKWAANNAIVATTPIQFPSA